MEIDILRRFKHPNLTAFYGVYGVLDHGVQKLWLAMELCDAGSVTDLAKCILPKRLPEPICAYVLHETLEALAFLHKHGVIHRDIKGQNLLLTSAGDVKIG